LPTIRSAHSGQEAGLQNTGGDSVLLRVLQAAGCGVSLTESGLRIIIRDHFQAGI
jgi:hypothetical protein